VVKGAISRVKDWLVLGFREGSIELIPESSKKKKGTAARREQCDQQ